MTSHPYDLILVDGITVSKSASRGYEKLRHRVRVSNPDEVRNTDFSGQFGGLYVATLESAFNLNTADTTTPDDGANCVRDLAGNGFFKVAVTLTEVEKEVAATGDVTLADDEPADVIYINNTSGAAISVYLPSAAVRTKAIRIIDGLDNAGTYPITILPKAGSGQKVLGKTDGSTSIIDSNSSSYLLKPRSTGTGYL